MKNYKLILIAFLFSAGMMAQDRGSIVLDVYGSYIFSDKVNFDIGYVDINDGFQYGAGLEFFPQKSSSVEIKYLRIDTSMPLYVAGVKQNAGDDKGAINYILLGGNHYFDNGNNAVPYLGGGIGMGILESPNQGNDTNFAWEIKGGVKIKTASIVSISLQASLQSMIAAAGTSTYWSGWYGPVVVQDYVYSYQFGLGAVIGFNFK
jgi:hypothetical protein